jgi:type II secretory pathway pseudopilin PulG
VELLIVIVVLGILAAVVIFALGGVSTSSAISACKADTASAEVAIAAFHAANPTIPVTQTLILGTADGGPYMKSWPGNLPHYALEINSGSLYVSVSPPGGVTGTGTYVSFTGPNSCNTVK